MNVPLATYLDPLPFVAVLRGITPEEIPSIGATLVANGFRILEVPLNSPRPFDSIRALADGFGDRCLVGAGTVVDIPDVAKVKAAGGRLIQDIDSEIETEVEHASKPADRKRHDIALEEGTQLAGILKERKLNVNSSHHQAIRTAGRGLRINAKAPDGIIEGLEDPELPFYVGVQWHPEDMTTEASGGSLFSAFVESARRHANREELMDFVEQVEPSTVVLGHGDAPARQWFEDQIRARWPKMKIHQPQPGKVIEA